MENKNTDNICISFQQTIIIHNNNNDDNTKIMRMSNVEQINAAIQLKWTEMNVIASTME